MTASPVFYGVGLPAWVFVGFMTAQVFITAVLLGLQALATGIENVNQSVLYTVAGAVIYAVTLLIIFGVPWLVGKRKTTRSDVGLNRLPTWIDPLWALAGVVVYVILSTIILAVSQVALPFVDFEQAQDTGFPDVLNHFEYILAFMSLVIIAPVAEEALFRGYLFGKLNKHMSVWVSIIITSLLFAFVHGQWNVGIDVFALSIVLCLLRVMTGSIWASILVHMIKNGIAFYLLFINPSLLSTLG